MKATAADGMVQYMVQHDDTGRTMPSLLDQGEKALAQLVATTSEHMGTLNTAYKTCGLE